MRAIERRTARPLGALAWASLIAVQCTAERGSVASRSETAQPTPRAPSADAHGATDTAGRLTASGTETDAAAAVDGPAKDAVDELGAWRRIHRVDTSRFDDLIVEAATYYSLPAALVKAVMAVESGFDPLAVSYAGAQGLMQLIPDTARQMHVGDSFEPHDNVYGGCRYLRILANDFDGDLRLTLAAYNAGPQAVRTAGGVPTIPQTQQYVRRVLALYHHYLSKWRIDRP